MVTILLLAALALADEPLLHCLDEAPASGVYEPPRIRLGETPNGGPPHREPAPVVVVGGCIGVSHRDVRVVELRDEPGRCAAVTLERKARNVHRSPGAPATSVVRTTWALCREDDLSPFPRADGELHLVAPVADTGAGSWAALVRDAALGVAEAAWQARMRGAAPEAR